MSIHIGTSMVRRRVLDDDASRDSKTVDPSFQREAIRGARLIATAILGALVAWGVVALVMGAAQ